jgi:hypothetical protein
VRKWSGLATDKLMDLSNCVKDNGILADVIRREGMMKSKMNIHDQRDVEKRERQARHTICYKISRRRGGTILPSNLNAHSCKWDWRCKAQCEQTIWEQILDEYRLDIVNDNQPTHHYTRTGAEGDATMDLTMDNQQITR